MGKMRELEATTIVLSDERASFLRRAQLLDKDCSAMSEAIATSGGSLCLPEQALSSSLAARGTAEEADAGRVQLAMLKISVLTQERNELETRNEAMKTQLGDINEELAKEVGAHLRAQQDLLSLETKFNQLEQQLHEKVVHQTQSHANDLDHARHESQHQRQVPVNAMRVFPDCISTIVAEVKVHTREHEFSV